MREWRTPLEVGNQKSEMKAQYEGKQDISPTMTTAFKAGPQPFNLAQHHVSGPSQNVIGSTQNKAISARPFFIRDKGVLNMNDIYASTTQRDHRSFKK